MGQPIIISKNPGDSLTGYLLVATPQIEGDFFRRSVIYVSEHNKEGAMGLIINAPIEEVTVNHILEQMDMTLRAGDRHLPVMFGGPVEPYRGFVLHNGHFLEDTALSARDGFVVSANAAVLTGWVEGSFTAKAMLAMGYAGWSPGQLESEIEQGSWVVIAPTETLVFDANPDDRWDMAIASLGFDMGNLSSTAGHA